MRLVEALKLLASTEGFFNSKERIVISIILFRCYFEGFGTSQDMNIARNFLIQAIQHGCLEAQAVLSVFCEATGSSIPSDMEGKSTDRIYAAAKRGSWVSLQDKYLNNNKQIW